MNSKNIITLVAALMPAMALKAQQTEPVDSLAQELQEVVVTARQPATKLVGTTLVSTIAGSNLADIGNALDVLAQLPMIKVVDDAVSVTGRSGIEIYIDGRPMRDNEELRQIQSSNISKVELLMAPGAAYESTTGAVLKITTRRNFVQGLSASDYLQVERRRRWSVMDNLNLGYRTGAWDIFLSGIVNHNNQLIKGSTTNTLVYDGKKTVVGSSQHNEYPSTVGVVKGGFNYARAAQSFGAYYRYNPEYGSITNTGLEWLDAEPPLSRQIDRTIHSHSHLVSAYYENTFGGKYMLHLDGDYRRSVAKNTTATIYPDAEANDVNSNDRRTSTLWAGKLYLNFPLFQGDMTIGTQDSHTHTVLNFNMLSPEVGAYIPSSLTDARQTSAALFATWSRTMGRFSLTAGLRYEYVDYDFTVNGERDKDVSRRDHLLTPDISLGYSFNDRAQLSLSYKLATVKPPYSQLTGSLNYVGQHEIEGGNPALRDEKMHDVQLFGMWGDFMLQADYLRSFDTYAYVKQLYPARDLQLLMHPVNIDVTALSVYAVWSRRIGPWTPNVALGIYKQWLRLDGTHYNRPIPSYSFNNTLALPRGWTLTLNMNGQGRGDMHTNRFGTTWFTADASVGKTLLNKALTVKLSATDIFNTASNDWTMNTYGVFVDKRQSYDRRGISLSVCYRFQPRKDKYKGSSASESELRRL